jgi:hypothetical protein
MKNRINKPITVTLSPESIEAIEVLKEKLEQTKVSPVIDSVIKEAMKSRGYTQKDTEMLVETSPVTVELVHSGQTLIKHAHDGQNFIQAPESGTYAIRLKNNTFQKKLVVVSVDGRNIMDGESAGFDGDGYVLHPWQTWDIKGWRRTSKEVAAFEFVDIEASYDKQVGGEGSNVGVIGVAVFDEKEKYTFWNQGIIHDTLYRNCFPTMDESIGGQVDYSSNSIQINSLVSESAGATSSTLATSNSPRMRSAVKRQTMGGAKKSVQPKQVGTGYGEKTEFNTVTVTFDKASDTPSDIIVLRYAAKSMLKKWGVIQEPVIPAVNPFPSEKISVKAPPNWKG